MFTALGKMDTQNPLPVQVSCSSGSEMKLLQMELRGFIARTLALKELLNIELFSREEGDQKCRLSGRMKGNRMLDRLILL